MEDLVKHTQRVTSGLAVEAAKRIVAANPESDEAAVRSILQQILLDWFTGEFFPGRSNEPMQPLAAQGVARAEPLNKNRKHSTQDSQTPPFEPPGTGSGGVSFETSGATYMLL